MANNIPHAALPPTIHACSAWFATHDIRKADLGFHHKSLLLYDGSLWWNVIGIQAKGFTCHAEMFTFSGDERTERRRIIKFIDARENRASYSTKRSSALSLMSHSNLIAVKGCDELRHYFKIGLPRELDSPVWGNSDFWPLLEHELGHTRYWLYMESFKRLSDSISRYFRPPTHLLFKTEADAVTANVALQEYLKRFDA